MKKIILLLLIIIPIICIKPSNTKRKEYIPNFSKYKYYKKDNNQRYINYYQKEKDINKVIKDVNINIDQPFYTNIKEANILDNETILINKYYKLPNNYNIKLQKLNNYSKDNMYLQEIAKTNYEIMAKDAEKLNLNLYVISAYRTNEYQRNLYTNYVKNDGELKADTYSARPGHSEHQTGLAIDIITKDSTMDTFEQTKEFIWLKDNSYKYGFILRYPKDKENETGYIYEPWHYRYIGIKHATNIYQKNISYEEYYANYIEKN